MEEMNTMDVSDSDYAEFAEAFGGEDGYQTEGTDTSISETEEQTETQQEPEGEEQESDSVETEEDDESAGTAESESKSTDGSAEQQFTLRVNKEDKVVTREEMFSLAQKGADYDRVKNQLAESRQTIENLQTRLDANQAAMEVLEMIAADTKMPINELIEQFHVNLRMKNGETEREARANIRAIKAEKKVQATETARKTQENSKARAEREVSEFRRRFPGVELTEELCSELMNDVKNGTSLSDAFQRRETARKDAEIEQLKKQLAAEQQNRKNRAKAVGSQNDSGGRRSKSAEDDFFAAFEK